MNVRIHFRDFSIKDFQGVKEIGQVYGGDRIEIRNEQLDEVGVFESHTITSIEVRL